MNRLNLEERKDTQNKDRNQLMKNRCRRRILRGKLRKAIGNPLDSREQVQFFRKLTIF